jgi:hypothetical protein
MNTDEDDMKHEALTNQIIEAFYAVVGLLLNFGAKPEIRRKVFDNPLKKAAQAL